MEIFIPKNGIIININCTEKSLISDIITSTKEIGYVVGYILGAGPVIRNGLRNIAGLIKEQTSKPLIYDHQKFINDLSEICNKDILNDIKDSGVDGIVVLPISGRDVLKSIIAKCSRINLLPLVCGNPLYPVYSSPVEGYIENDIQQKIYLDAVNLGVLHLIMSCSHMERIKIICHQLDAIAGQLKIFFTSINSAECKELPDICSQIKQNKAYAIFDAKFISSEEYLQSLSTFWDNFRKKLGIY